MANVTYYIRATDIGSGYPTGTTFQFFTDQSLCGISAEAVNVSTDIYSTPTENTPITKTEFQNGFRVDLDESIQYLYASPSIINIRTTDCRLGCTNVLDLTGYVVPTSTPTPTPTPTITAAPATPTATPTLTPTPTQQEPLPNWVSFGNWTIQKFGNNGFRFTNTGYNRLSEGQALGNYLAADGYLPTGNTETIKSGIRIHTSEQSSLQQPDPAYLYINLDTYNLQGISSVTWYSDATTVYIDLQALNTVPVDFPSRMDVFLYYNVND